MRAMVFNAPGTPLVPRDLPAPPLQPGEHSGCASARAGSAAPDLHIVDGRACPAQAPARARTSDRRRGDRGRRRRRGARRGGSRRRPLARLDVRPVPLLSGRARKPLRARPLHGIRQRRGVCRGVPRGRALRLPDPGRLRRPPGGAAPVRGAHRLPSAAHDGRCARSSASIGFGAAAHILVQVARHQGRRVHALTRPATGRRRTSRAPSARSWAGGSDESPPEPLDAALSSRPSERSCPRPCGATPSRGRRRLRGDPHERHPVVPLRALVG